MFENAITDFGRRLGMRSLSAEGGGRIELFFGGLGRLRVECAGEWTVVTLSRPLPPGNGVEGILRDACGLPRSHPWEVNPAGADADSMALAARVPLPELTGGVIEELVGCLSELLDMVEKGGRA